MTILAFLVIVLHSLGVSVDQRLNEIAHYEAPVGFFYIIFDKLRLLRRKRRLRTLQRWYAAAEEYERACARELYRRLRFLTPARLGASPSNPAVS